MVLVGIKVIVENQSPGGGSSSWARAGGLGVA